jgi:hypothetical protein
LNNVGTAKVDLMDDIATALIGARIGQMQLAVAASMLRMNADNAQSVAKLIDSAEANGDRLANVAAGIGGNLDISV